MKRFLSICVMLIAMTIAVGHSVVPHHEHGYKIHFSLACESDCATDHHESKPSADGCISQMDEAILLSKEDNKCPCGGHDILHPVPIYTLFSIFQIPIDSPLDQLNKGRIHNTDYSNLYTSTYIPQSKGLRAPPASNFL